MARKGSRKLGLSSWFMIHFLIRPNKNQGGLKAIPTLTHPPHSIDSVWSAHRDDFITPSPWNVLYSFNPLACSLPSSSTLAPIWIGLLQALAVVFSSPPHPISGASKSPHSYLAPLKTSIFGCQWSSDCLFQLKAGYNWWMPNELHGVNFHFSITC